METGEIIKSVSTRNLRTYAALSSFIFGILIASFVSVPPLVCLLIIAVALAIYYAEKHIIILIALIALALGAFRYDIKDFHVLEPAGDSGIVVSEPDHRDADTRFVVETNTGEKVLVTTSLLSEVEYGDEVKLLGSARTLKPGYYADYLAKDDIFYTLSGKVEVLSRGHGYPIKSLLLKLKSAFVGQIRNILPEPEASLLAGLIVSGKQALPQETLEDFRRAGVIHIVVLSGFNITIIAGFLYFIFRFLGPRRAALLSGAGVFLFVIMSGAPATVVRGAIMVLLLLLGKVIHRQGSPARIILFTSVLMLLWNPKALVFDPSFALSFLALLGLIYGTPLLQRFAEKTFASHGREGNSRQISSRLLDLIYATLATQIFVLPYLLYNMGNFSLVFLLANLLILPAVPVVMLVGFLAALLGFVSQILAWPLAFVSHLLLAWILKVAGWLGGFRFSEIQVEDFPLLASLAIYALIGFMLWQNRESLKDSHFERL